MQMPFLYIFLLVSLFGSLYSDTECPAVSTNNHNTTKPIKTENKLRVIQYNVEWLFMDYFASADCPGNGCTWKNKTAATMHIETISNIISKLSASTDVSTIINLCEVEGCDELNMLVQQLANGYTPYLKKGKDVATGQNAGILTQLQPAVSLYRTEERYNYPIAGSKCNYTGELASTGVSKHYITEFSINKLNIAFIGAHFIAFPTDPPRCAEREAQAMIMQNVIFSYISKGFEVIFLGDLNDYDGEALDKNNNQPTSNVLEILKGKYTGKYELINVANLIKQADRYSAWWDKNGNCVSTPNEFSTIDHMLVTPTLYKQIDSAFYYHGYTEKCDIYESDHYPLVVDFVFE